MDLETETVDDRGGARGGRRGEGSGSSSGSSGAPVQTGGIGGVGSSVVLGPRDSLVGRLTVEGDLRIQGTVEGEIKVSGDVQIDPDSNITATVDGRNVTIRGSVSGNVTASQKLVLAGNGVVSGDVRVARLAVEDGATLNGNVSMTASSAAAGAAAGSGSSASGGSLPPSATAASSAASFGGAGSAGHGGGTPGSTGFGLPREAAPAPAPSPQPASEGAELG